MDANLGRLTAHLADIPPDREGQLAELINININPPDRVDASDVYIRAMYLASDEVNSFGGRFPIDELHRLAELMIDSPVLVGHRKDRLPVGRTFLAEIVNHQNKTWVKSYFYWLRSAEGSLTLKDNIDGGIYKECSVGFTFQYPECSICGEDIRRCEHEPFEKYPSVTGSQSCHFLYRKVERVLESSLVYRGAVPGTSVTRELATAEVMRVDEKPPTIQHPAELDIDGEYLITPVYEGIRVIVSNIEGRLAVARRESGELVTECLQLDNCGLEEFFDVEGLLIGMRGKERCSCGDLEKFLDSGKGRVSRVILRLYPEISEDGAFANYGESKSIGVIPHETATVDQVDMVSRRLMTREGVHIRKLGAIPNDPGFIFIPNGKASTGKTGYSLTLSGGTGDALLRFYNESDHRSFLIRQFSLARFRKGGRYLCDEVSNGNCSRSVKELCVYSGDLEVQSCADSFILMLRGKLDESAVLQPIRINGMHRFLFYRTDPGSISSDNARTIDLSEDEDVHEE